MSDMGLSHGDMKWFCLLYSAGAGSVDNGTMAMGLDSQGLDHWRGVVWDPSIVGQQCLHVCLVTYCFHMRFLILPLFDGFVPSCDVISS